MEITSNGALIIDDKISLIEQMSEPASRENNAEYKNLRLIQNFFLFNNIPLYTLKDIASYPADAINTIKSIPDIDVLIIDLDLNSDGFFDEYDTSLIARILSEIKNKFNVIPIIIYSSLADQWNEIKLTLVNDDSNLIEILHDDNVWVVKKGDNKGNEILLETINQKIKLRIKEDIDSYIGKAIATSKFWRLEWLLITISFLVLLLLSVYVFNIRTPLVVATIIIVILLLAKLLYKEQFTIQKLKNVRKNEKHS